MGKIDECNEIYNIGGSTNYTNVNFVFLKIDPVKLYEMFFNLYFSHNPFRSEKIARLVTEKILKHNWKENFEMENDKDGDCFVFNVGSRKYKILALNQDKSSKQCNVHNNSQNRFRKLDPKLLEEFLASKQQENRKWHVLTSGECTKLLESLGDVVRLKYIEEDVLLFMYLTDFKGSYIVKGSDGAYRYFHCPAFIDMGHYYFGSDSIDGTVLLAIIEENDKDKENDGKNMPINK